MKRRKTSNQIYTTVIFSSLYLQMSSSGFIPLQKAVNHNNWEEKRLFVWNIYATNSENKSRSSLSLVQNFDQSWKSVKFGFVAGSGFLRFKPVFWIYLNKTWVLSQEVFTKIENFYCIWYFLLIYSTADFFFKTWNNWLKSD